MKKNIILLGAVLFGSAAYSQVGINTETPKTTMDVSAKRDGSGTLTDNAQTYGLQAPRLTRAELTSSTAAYGTDQTGAIVYITDISGGNTTGQRVNITAIGYYYFDGDFWQKITNNSTLASEPWRNQTDNTEANANTQNIYQGGRVAINKTSGFVG